MLMFNSIQSCTVRTMTSSTAFRECTNRRKSHVLLCLYWAGFIKE